MAIRTQKKSKQTRNLTVQPLEQRQLMAGDVSVTVSEYGNLRITGDGARNGVEVWQAAPGSNTWLVRGTSLGGSATRVNGHSLVAAFPGVTNDLRIDLNGGSDKVVVRNGIVKDDVVIAGDGGSDKIYLSKMVIKDDLFITSDLVGGRGSDTISLVDTVVRDRSFIKTRGGNDKVSITRSQFRDDLNLDTGSGRDKVVFNKCDVDELFADLGSGKDKMYLYGSSFDRFDVDGGSNYDQLLVGKGNDADKVVRSSIATKRI